MLPSVRQANQRSHWSAIHHDEWRDKGINLIVHHIGVESQALGGLPVGVFR